jgi:transcriptional regulator with XRE-family HTH domain
MGNPVRKLRETLGLSQVAFGELIGRSHQSVRNYEGKITLTREVIEKLKTVAVERGHPEIAMELSNPVEPPKNTSQKSQKNSERNERWHRLL